MADAHMDVAEVGAVLARIRGGEEPSYLILTTDPENKKRVNLTSVGRCGLRSLRRFLSEDQIQFGAFRVMLSAAGVPKVQRVYFFTWKGPKASLKSKMAAQNVRAPVQAFFEGCPDIEFSSWEELEEKAVTDKLISGKGAFKNRGGGERRQGESGGGARRRRKCVPISPRA